MVVEQRPGVAVGVCGDQKVGKPLHEMATIVLVGEDGAPFDAADDYVLQDVLDVVRTGRE
jgi:hypothetical protein